MRILVGMPEKNAWGGPNASEPPILAELRRMGVGVEEETYVYANQTERITLRTRFLRVFRTARVLRKRVNNGNFDIVHLNTRFDLKAVLRDLFVVFYIQPFSGRIFLKFHGSDAQLMSTRNPVLRLLRRSLFSKIDGVGFLSLEEQQKFDGSEFKLKHAFLMKCAVDRGRFRCDLSFRPRLEIEEDTTVLLFCSRFAPGKGLIETIRACGIIRDKGERFILLCLGDGQERREAENEVARLMLQTHVRFLGYVSEDKTDEFYANSTLLVFPTYCQEGLPMVILKSIAAGLPIVTTRMRGAADYLNEPCNCLWVEPKNPVILAERIIYLIRHPELRANMERHNRELAQKFAPKIVAQELLAIYNQLLEKKAEPPVAREGAIFGLRMPGGNTRT